MHKLLQLYIAKHQIMMGEVEERLGVDELHAPQLSGWGLVRASGSLLSLFSSCSLLQAFLLLLVACISPPPPRVTPYSVSLCLLLLPMPSLCLACSVHPLYSADPPVSTRHDRFS